MANSSVAGKPPVESDLAVLILLCIQVLTTLDEEKKRCLLRTLKGNERSNVLCPIGPGEAQTLPCGKSRPSPSFQQSLPHCHMAAFGGEKQRHAALQRGQTTLVGGHGVAIQLLR